MTTSYDVLLERCSNCVALAPADAVQLLATDKQENIMRLAQLADTVRKKYRANKIDFCSLINAKSGRCSENCSFCAQSGHYNTAVTTYPFIDSDAIVAKAKAAEKFGSHRFCIVTSGAQLTDDDFEKTLVAYRRIREESALKIDGSLGFLTENRVQALKDVGLSRYNHNLETSRRYYPAICTTHSYEDRLHTIRLLREYDIEVCCGGIIGMGETINDRVDLAFTLNKEGVSCIPINILNPRHGTPLEKNSRLSPLEIIATIAVFRLINPSATIKIAGGREEGLGEHQALSLQAGGNGFIIGGYLTTMGNDPQQDIAIAKDAGYEV